MIDVPSFHFFNIYVVKFNKVDILNEGDTQAFVYTALRMHRASQRSMSASRGMVSNTL